VSHLITFIYFVISNDAARFLETIFGDVGGDCGIILKCIKVMLSEGMDWIQLAQCKMMIKMMMTL
jgi:hypothetical protein